MPRPAFVSARARGASSVVVTPFVPRGVACEGCGDDASATALPHERARRGPARGGSYHAVAAGRRAPRRTAPLGDSSSAPWIAMTVARRIDRRRRAQAGQLAHRRELEPEQPPGRVGRRLLLRPGGAGACRDRDCTLPTRPRRKPRSARACRPRSWRSSRAGVDRPTPSRLAPPAGGLALGRKAIVRRRPRVRTNAIPGRARFVREAVISRHAVACRVDRHGGGRAGADRPSRPRGIDRPRCGMMSAVVSASTRLPI